MPDVFSTFGPFTFRTYTVLIGLGVVISIIVTMFALRHSIRPARVMDVSLAGVIGGIIVARGTHVWLNWAYFGDHTDEITQIKSGGLNWHGAVIGALLTMWLVAYLRKVDYPKVLAMLAPALPIMTIASWWACGSAQCSYGKEVDNLSEHPSWLVWEAKDIFNLIAPRYRTQALGMALGIGLLLILVLIIWRGWVMVHADRRFWLILALLSLGMFGVGSLRGDYAYMFGRLRADQVFDLVFIGVSLVIFAWRSRSIQIDNNVSGETQ